MCTAICDGILCGRTLDNEISYGEEIITIPRGYEINLLYQGKVKAKKAILGVGILKEDYPLIYDGINEYGLFMAGLNFVGNAHYLPASSGKFNLATFELIPYILSSCTCISQVKEAFKDINITDDSFDKSLAYSQLHWIAYDKDSAVVIEATENGIKIYDNYAFVLTNNPTFDFHMTNLANYMSLSPKAPINQICPNVDLPIYSRGMGSLGLPGDFSSASRFVRAVFLKNHTRAELGTDNQINRFFHILNGLDVPKGCVINQDGLPVYTIYSNCYDLNNFCIYYRCYDSMEIKKYTPTKICGQSIIEIKK